MASALATVTDPELDRPLVELGFAHAEVDAVGRVTIELRLPTYWCAANFAYLMAADAHDAVASVPGVRSVTVRLHDHFTAGEVTDAVNAGRSFDDAFADRADGSGLAALRRLFLVKAFTVRQDRLLRLLLAQGYPPARVCAMRLGEVGAGTPEWDAYLDRRRRLGLPSGADSPLAMRPNGSALRADELEPYLRRAQLTRVGMEANTSLCSGLHATRYSTVQGVMT